jgi:hypothetical protein
MMCVPADKHHAKVHGAHSKDKMEKPIPIWYIVFRLYYVPELQIFKQ